MGSRLDFYKVVAERLLIHDSGMRRSAEEGVARRTAAAGGGQVAKELSERWVDTMVRTRKSLIKIAIAKAQNEADLQRVVYFFNPSFGLAVSYHKLPGHTLDWNKIWKADPNRVEAAKKIKQKMMVSWLDPRHKMARNRLKREFNAIQGNLAQ